ncbi:MAG: electron transfer flavoprotein subunit alpha/FixB family protein [Pseudomonadota bacterium]
MSKVLVIGEHDGATLNPSTAKTVTCAAAVGEVTVAIFASGGADICAEAAGLEGVARVLHVDSADNDKPLAAVQAPQIAELAADFTHVFGPSTTFGKDLMPRVAALLGVPQVSDLMEVIDERTFKRPIYAGNIVTTVKAPADHTVVATVRTASYQAAASGAGPASVDSASTGAANPGHTRWVELAAASGERPDLQAAPVVVSGGRGVGSEEKFSVIYDFADAIGAAVGASRAAVDAGYCPNDMQVGQTGKIIAPDLYFAVGISGAIQHLTGIKDAGTIVAINKDGEAPIFSVADFGIVGDLFEIVPQLQEALA